VKFVIDEDLPRSTAKILKAKGFEVYDIRDHGLRGRSDEEIPAFARQQEAVLVTGDLGFGNLLRFPIGSHDRILVAHFPDEISTAELNAQIVGALTILTQEELKGSLTILEPGNIRSRKN